MAIYSGDIFAENYTVSSSVTNVQIAAVSGSMKFGDSGDDTHQFTGSLFISGSRISFTDGKKNTTLGNLAGDAITSGTENTILGEEAGTAISTGAYNTLLGYRAGKGFTTGHGNTVVGREAMDSSETTLQENTVVGYQAAGNASFAADKTVIIGSQAGLGGGMT